MYNNRRPKWNGHTLSGLGLDGFNVMLGLGKLSTSMCLGLGLEPHFVWVRPLRLVFVLDVSGSEAGVRKVDTPEM